MNKRIAYIIGTRPEFIRSAYIINTLRADSSVDFKLVHTGQHYDYAMNDIFFNELNLAAPDINLSVGSGSHIHHISEIMKKLEEFFHTFQPELVAVFGDTNSTLAAGLATVKLGIPLAHIEAGAREYEMDMPEEVNRRLVDQIANVLMCASESHKDNLEREHVPGKVVTTGDPQYDVFQTFYAKGQKLNTLEGYQVKPNEFILMTLHRAHNVDQDTELSSFLHVLNDAVSVPIVFPVHPRTKKYIDQKGLATQLRHIRCIEPLGYIEMNHVLANAQYVITDSGGLQKEAFWAKKPCITLREHTAWSETVDLGVNILSNFRKETIQKHIHHMETHLTDFASTFTGLPNPYFKPDTSDVIVDLMKQFAGKPW